MTAKNPKQQIKAIKCGVYTYMCVCVLAAQSCSTLRLFATPWTASHQASLFMGFSWQEYWNRLPFPSLGDLPNQGIKPRFTTLQADSSPSEPSGKPHRYIHMHKCEMNSSKSLWQA